MKKVVLLIASLASCVAVSQSSNPNIMDPNSPFASTARFNNNLGLESQFEQTLIINRIDINKIEAFGSARDFDDIRFGRVPTDGSVMLFNEWENRGVIEVDDKRYIFSNMNFHLLQSTFMSKIDNDSVVSFDLSTFNRIVINDLTFKSIYNPAKSANENFQVIYEGSDMSILKNYEIVVREASPNPMVNRKNRKIQKKGHYFLKDGNSIKPFKFKKKSIVALAGDKSEDMIEYAKINSLSFRDDKDVSRMLALFVN